MRKKGGIWPASAELSGCKSGMAGWVRPGGEGYLRPFQAVSLLSPINNSPPNRADVEVTGGGLVGSEIIKLKGASCLGMLMNRRVSASPVRWC